MWYLNVLAGPGDVRSMAISDDPAHAWVRGSWPEQVPDPRVPMIRPADDPRVTPRAWSHLSTAEALQRARTLDALAGPDGVVCGAAADHRDALRAVLEKRGLELRDDEVGALKARVAGALAPAATMLLLDVELGAPAAIAGGRLPGTTALVVPLEQGGYGDVARVEETTLMPGWSPEAARHLGAAACKLLLPFRTDVPGPGRAPGGGGRALRRGLPGSRDGARAGADRLPAARRGAGGRALRRAGGGGRAAPGGPRPGAAQAAAPRQRGGLPRARRRLRPRHAVGAAGRRRGGGGARTRSWRRPARRGRPASSSAARSGATRSSPTRPSRSAPCWSARCRGWSGSRPWPAAWPRRGGSGSARSGRRRPTRSAPAADISP